MSTGLQVLVIWVILDYGEAFLTFMRQIVVCVLVGNGQDALLQVPKWVLLKARLM